MTRTVKEWIEFLNMGNNHFIGLEKENGVKCSRVNYFIAHSCVKNFEDYLNEIVVKTYISNFKVGERYFHLLVYKG